MAKLILDSLKIIKENSFSELLSENLLKFVRQVVEEECIKYNKKKKGIKTK